MPHRCTRCGAVFENGDAAILSGCPNCGWNKFLYVRKGDETLEKEDSPAKEEQKKDSPVKGEQKNELESSFDEVVRNIDQALASEEESVDKEKEAEKEDKERVESVRILGPGSYELNLDSLFGRKELVMAIKEEGSYALHLPSVFSSQREAEKSRERGKGKGRKKQK